MTIRDLNNPFNRYSLLLSSPHQLICWLQKESLLVDIIRCERYDDDCHLGVQERVIGGFVWHCRSRHEISIRRHSIFSKSPFHLQDINFVITYAEGQSLWKCSEAAGIGYGSTAVDWGSFCRDLFMEYYVREIRDVKLSGQVEMGGVFVEISSWSITFVKLETLNYLDKWKWGGVFVEISSWSITFVKLETLNYLDKWKWGEFLSRSLHGVLRS